MYDDTPATRPTETEIRAMAHAVGCLFRLGGPPLPNEPETFWEGQYALSDIYRVLDHSEMHTFPKFALALHNARIDTAAGFRSFLRLVATHAVSLTLAWVLAEEPEIYPGAAPPTDDQVLDASSAAAYWDECPNQPPSKW